MVRLLTEVKKREIKLGNTIAYVWTYGSGGVKPVELAGIGEVNTDRYLEMMESSFRQVLSAFSIDFEQDVMGLPTDLNLEGLFWSKV